MSRTIHLYLLFTYSEGVSDLTAHLTEASRAADLQAFAESLGMPTDDATTHEDVCVWLDEGDITSQYDLGEDDVTVDDDVSPPQAARLFVKATR